MLLFAAPSIARNSVVLPSALHHAIQYASRIKTHAFVMFDVCRNRFWEERSCTVQRMRWCSDRDLAVRYGTDECEQCQLVAVVMTAPAASSLQPLLGGVFCVDVLRESLWSC
jgi:hypothetical protein